MIAQPQRTNQKGKESGWAGCSGPRPAETCKVSGEGCATASLHPWPDI